MDANSAFVIWPCAGFLAAFVCLFFAIRAGQKRRLVDNLPPTKTTGVFIGWVELKGAAEAEEPLTSFLAELACVHYAWNIQEHWSRTVTETVTDNQGQMQTRTRRESGWTSVANGSEQIPFYLRDDSGVIRIDPAKAKIEAVSALDVVCGPSDPRYYLKGPRAAIQDTDNQRRFSETIIPLHASIYVMGQARERKDIVAPEIAYDPGTPMFLISTRSEAQVSSRLHWKFWLLGLLGLGFAVGGFVASDTAVNRGFEAHA